MSEPLPDRKANEAPAPDVQPRAVGSPPRWVTVVVIVVGALIVLAFVLLHLSGAMGPGAH